MNENFTPAFQESFFWLKTEDLLSVSATCKYFKNTLNTQDQFWKNISVIEWKTGEHIYLGERYKNFNFKSFCIEQLNNQKSIQKNKEEGYNPPGNSFYFIGSTGIGKTAILRFMKDNINHQFMTELTGTQPRTFLTDQNIVACFSLISKKSWFQLKEFLSASPEKMCTNKVFIVGTHADQIHTTAQSEVVSFEEVWSFKNDHHFESYCEVSLISESGLNILLSQIVGSTYVSPLVN